MLLRLFTSAFLFRHYSRNYAVLHRENHLFMSNLALLTAQVCRYNCLNKLSYLDFNRAIKQFYTVKTTGLCQI